MGVGAKLAVVVPSLGEGPDPGRALERLREGPLASGATLVWVHQGERPAPALAGPRERLLRYPRPLGFARAANAGLAAAGDAELVALVNDDVELEAGWLAPLVAALAEDPRLGAVQGVCLRSDAPELADGCGLAWNLWWQAVQLGRDRPAPGPGSAAFEVFGVSATAAVYRRAAVERVATAPGTMFDPRLDSWYEDVDLAVRLRAAGATAACVPASRARHVGSATGGRRPFHQARRVAAHRWLVVARLLGRRWWLAWPRLLVRDVIDAGRATLGADWARAAAVPAGWASVLFRIGGFLSAGPPRIAPEELARFRVGSAT
jgi:GT2 family glycosyltransferase